MLGWAMVYHSTYVRLADRVTFEVGQGGGRMMMTPWRMPLCFRPSLLVIEVGELGLGRSQGSVC